MDQEILRLLPLRLAAGIQKLPRSIADTIEEIRIRVDRPTEIVSSTVEGFLTSAGTLTNTDINTISISIDEGLHFLSLISNHSMYALEEELRRGYITISGGHRVGMSGKVILENGQVHLLKEVTSFNIRIAREKIGIGNTLIPHIWENKRLYNTLIVSPPRCGKTTMLRDLARIFSTGDEKFSIFGYKVGLVDERSEIAGCINGIPQKNVGLRTDVLDGCPKAEGMMMLIRSMSPQIIVVDEIGRNEDVAALLEAMNTGVSLITSAHGHSIEDLTRRPSFNKIISMGIFERYVILSKRNGAGTIESIYDQKLRPLIGSLR